MGLTKLVGYAKETEKDQYFLPLMEYYHSLIYINKTQATSPVFWLITQNTRLIDRFQFYNLNSLRKKEEAVTYYHWKLANTGKWSDA